MSESQTEENADVESEEETTQDSGSSSSGQYSRRENAYRVFAEELQHVEHLFKSGDGDYAPNYGLLPTGEAANRVFLVGTLMEYEDVGNGDQPYWRAKINDISNNAFVYCGEYQPEAAAKLQTFETPEHVAVVGKVSSFDVDDGDDKMVFIKPEKLYKVDKLTRDQWVMETASQTLDRLEDDDAEYADLAKEHYGDDLVDVTDNVRDGVVRALEGLEFKDE